MRVITLEPGVDPGLLDAPWGFVVLRWVKHMTRAGLVYDEAHLLWVCLPSWGFGYDYPRDEDRWGQRVLFYHGKQGFSIRWRFVKETPDV